MSPFTEKYIPLTYFFWKMHAVFIYLAGFSKPGKTVKRKIKYQLSVYTGYILTNTSVCLQSTEFKHLTPPLQKLNTQEFTNTNCYSNNFSP